MAIQYRNEIFLFYIILYKILFFYLNDFIQNDVFLEKNLNLLFKVQ